MLARLGGLMQAGNLSGGGVASRAVGYGISDYPTQGTDVAEYFDPRVGEVVCFLILKACLILERLEIFSASSRTSGLLRWPGCSSELSLHLRSFPIHGRVVGNESGLIAVTGLDFQLGFKVSSHM